MIVARAVAMTAWVALPVDILVVPVVAAMSPVIVSRAVAWSLAVALMVTGLVAMVCRG